MNEVTIPRPKFDEMTKASSVQTIAEKGKAAALVVYERKEYVITGSISSYHTGYTAVWGHEVIDLAKYAGKLKPLNYSDLHDAARTPGSGYQIGYGHMLIKYEGRDLVMVDPQITFKPSKEGTQTNLF